jgi:hypothetical protein
MLSRPSARAPGSRSSKPPSAAARSFRSSWRISSSKVSSWLRWPSPRTSGCLWPPVPHQEDIRGSHAAPDLKWRGVRRTTLGVQLCAAATRSGGLRTMRPRSDRGAMCQHRVSTICRSTANGGQLRKAKNVLKCRLSKRVALRLACWLTRQARGHWFEPSTAHLNPRKCGDFLSVVRGQLLCRSSCARYPDSEAVSSGRFATNGAAFAPEHVGLDGVRREPPSS